MFQLYTDIQGYMNVYSGKNFVYCVVKDNRGHYKKVLVQVIYDK